MCGPVITGLPKCAGSRMLCPPACTSVPPMKTTSASENSPLNSPMVSSSSTPGSASVSPSCNFDRRRCGVPASLAAVSSNVAGLRGARMSSNRGCRSASSRNAVSAASSSLGGMVLAATQICRGAIRSISIGTGESGAAGRASKSYLKLPAVRTRSAGAPMARNRSRISSDWARMASTQGRTAPNSQPRRRYRGNPRSEMRPLTRSSAAQVRLVSRNRLGQISVSAMTTTEGFSARKTRLTTNTKSTGA